MWLYDTFEGMTEPRRAATPIRRARACADVWDRHRGRDGRPVFALRRAGGRAGEHGADGLPDASACTSSRGTVEDTIPATAPERIALLRLDTDWYESTRHELEHLYPRLSPGGVLIIDDYGHWAGRPQGGRRVLRRPRDAPCSTASTTPAGSR